MIFPTRLMVKTNRHRGASRSARLDSQGPDRASAADRQSYCRDALNARVAQEGASQVMSKRLAPHAGSLRSM
jgi:hypothetical protein